MSPIQKVAVLGPSGNLGETIVPALVKAGFTVTVISRPGSKGYVPSESDKPLAESIVHKTAAYDDLSALQAAMQGQDALVEAFNPAANDHQRIIVQAALASGLKHIITNEFGLDTFHANASEVRVNDIKIEAQRALEEEVRNAPNSQLAWTGIITGGWYDWALRAGKLWLNLSTHTVTRFGSGKQKASLSRLSLCGDATVHVLKNSDQFRNRPAYFASQTFSTNELKDMVQEIGKEQGQSWTVADVPDIDAMKKEGLRLWEEDTKNGVKSRLGTTAYALVATAAVFDEHDRYGVDFSDKVEPGWDIGRAAFKEHIKQLDAEVNGK